MTNPIAIAVHSCAQTMQCERCQYRVAFDPFDDEAIAAAVAEFAAHACVPKEVEVAS